MPLFVAPTACQYRGINFITKPLWDDVNCRHTDCEMTQHLWFGMEKLTDHLEIELEPDWQSETYILTCKCNDTISVVAESVFFSFSFYCCSETREMTDKTDALQCYSIEWVSLLPLKYFSVPLGTLSTSKARARAFASGRWLWINTSSQHRLPALLFSQACWNLIDFNSCVIEKL